MTGARNAVARQGETEIEIDISLVPLAKPGDYVIVHAGFAIQILQEDDAEERLELLGQIADAGSEGP
jgi:hydrogenase expression/formation protein HypC